MNVMNLILAVTAAAAVTATEEELPEVEIPVVTAPKVEVPVVEIPKVDVPEVERPVIIVPGVTGMEIVGSGEASTAGVTVPQVASVSDRVPEMMKMIRTAKSFADQRNLRFEPEISLDSAVWRKWMKIYQSNQPYTPAYKELPQGLRIIAEVKCPEDEGQEATLGKNLDFYAKQGYNAALLTFDTTENIDRLLETAKIIRAHGMKIVCAYSGPEKLRWSIYRDPDVIEQYVSRVCAVSDAFLIGWCRTSAHLLIMDRPFRDHLLRAARKLNPDVAIIGEAFYGETALNRRTVTYNVPDNASAVLLFGIGYKGIAIELAMDGMFDKVKHLPRIGLAIGEKPYFDTKNNTGRTFAENLRIKQRIERRFRKGGCVATLTIRGDGSDGIYDKKITENLTMPYGKEEVMAP